MKTYETLHENIQPQETAIYKFDIDLENDRAWFLSADEVFSGQSHSSILRKEFATDLEKMTKGGLELLEAESSIERRLLQFGYVSIGTMKDRFYAVVYQLDKITKGILQGFCQSINVDNDFHIQSQLEKLNKKFTVKQIAGDVLFKLEEK